MNVITSQEPRVTILVDGHPINFLLDTGATFSVFREFWGPTSPSKSPIAGVGGQTIFPKKTPILSCSFSVHPFSHTFLIMSQCPVPLLGGDILSKFQASISFSLAPSLILILAEAIEPTPNRSPSIPPSVNPKSGTQLPPL